MIQQPPPQPKRRGCLYGILGAVGAFILILVILLIIGAVVSSSSGGTGGHPAAANPATAGTPFFSSPSPSSSPSPPPSSPTPAASPTAPPHVLLSFSGNGIKNSAPFLVVGPVSVKYSYDCSSFGGSGNFIADLEYGNQASLNSDDQPIANALSSGGSATTMVYPQDPGQHYYVSVDSECDWSITVTGQ